MSKGCPSIYSVLIAPSVVIKVKMRSTTLTVKLTVLFSYVIVTVFWPSDDESKPLHIFSVTSINLVSPSLYVTLILAPSGSSFCPLIYSTLSGRVTSSIFVASFFITSTSNVAVFP